MLSTHGPVRVGGGEAYTMETFCTIFKARNCVFADEGDVRRLSPQGDIQRVRIFKRILLVGPAVFGGLGSGEGGGAE
jgi:hypothetical protein